jgi:hypothetical protein
VALALAASLCLAGAASSAGSASHAHKEAKEAMTKPPAGPPAESGKLETDAIDALKEMSTYLATLTAFEVKAETTRDLVTQNGHRVQLGGESDYLVRRPNGFRIDVTTDYKSRQFYYDGKTFTIFAPKLGYYGTADAPPTILQTIDVLENRFGIDLPLDDLFRWNDPASHQMENLGSGFYVGAATVDGTPTDHYAFRQKDGKIDWEIWIQQGDQPLPRKLVIIDRTDEARPAYTARLAWTINPTIAADSFTFHPGPDAKSIRMATLEQGE